jgi:hypothetical protein
MNRMKKTSHITPKRNRWPNLLAKVLGFEFDQYGCVVVTQKNFKRIVIDSHDNVLVIFYTDVRAYDTSVDFQENQEPKLPLKGLADSYNDRHSHVIIARCNVAENDVPVRVYHTPTIRYYPIHGKRSPIEYFGEKEDVNKYIDFIQNEGPQDSKLKPVSRRNTATVGDGQTKCDIKEQVHILEPEK